MEAVRVTKGLAGVTKGMAVRGPYAGPVDVGGLYMPGGSGGVVERASTLVAGGGAGTLMKRRQDVDAVLALDVHGGHRATRGDCSHCGSGGGSGSRGLGALASAALGGGGHAGVERGELVHHTFVLVLLVCVDGLSVLAEVVEPRKLLAAVAGEGSLAGVLSARGEDEDGGGNGEGRVRT